MPSREEPRHCGQFAASRPLSAMRAVVMATIFVARLLSLPNSLRNMLSSPAVVPVLPCYDVVRVNILGLLRPHVKQVRAQRHCSRTTRLLWFVDAFYNETH